MLLDVDRIRAERRKAKANKNKYTGVGNDGMSFSGSFGGGGSGRYGGFGSDSLGGGSSYSGYDSSGGYGSRASGYDRGRLSYYMYTMNEARLMMVRRVQQRWKWWLPRQQLKCQI